MIKGQSDLYDTVQQDEEQKFIETTAPLAARMRPKKLADYIGQQHMLGEGKPLRKTLERGSCSSMILWGPPGVGKTTLAELFALQVDARVERMSAVTSGVKEIRAAIDIAERNLKNGMRTVLFVDEVHRFNKSQQDAFLPYIENGTIIFIGATTENPSFELNNAILSRARVYILKPLTIEEIEKVIMRALLSPAGLKAENLVLDKGVLKALAQLSEGDARRALNLLEIVADLAENGPNGTRIITL